MEEAAGIIRRETREGPEVYEPAFLKALADGVIQARRTIQYKTDVPGGVQQGPTKNLPPGFWTREVELQRGVYGEPPSRAWAMREPNENEYWYFEIRYDDLQAWLSPEKPSAAGRGRPPKWDWEEFWIQTVLLADMPDGLPEKQSAFEENMAQWFTDTVGDSPPQSQIREKAGKLYRAKKTFRSSD
jgi:hypothetical protein